MVRPLWFGIADLTGFDGAIVWDTSKPNGQPRRKLDVSRARETFGFQARTPFDAGLHQTITWYLAQPPQDSTDDPEHQISQICGSDVDLHQHYPFVDFKCEPGAIC